MLVAIASICCRIRPMPAMASSADFVSALAAQADAFAAFVAGEGCEGAGGADAVAALQVAERIDHSLTSAGGA